MSMLRDVGRRRRRIRSTLARATGATALVTAAAVLMGVIQAPQALAAPAPEEDTGYTRNSVGESPGVTAVSRVWRCTSADRR